MARIVPTVLASNPDEFKAMVERAQSLSNRVHVDITDGDFTDGQTINLSQVYVKEGVSLDLHLMVVNIEDHLQTALSLKPRLIIIHAESKGNLPAVISEIKSMGVDAGVAILPDTKVETARELIGTCDHVLIFTGKLGYNGGKFQDDQLSKVSEVRAINPYVEISVDGGVNIENAKQIKDAGIDILYAGGSIQKAENPEKAFEQLNNEIGGGK